MLAQAFLEVAGTDDWWATFIVPQPEFKGMHVFANNSRYVFDYHGFTPLGMFQKHYFKKMGRWFPGWSANFIDLDVSPVSEEFCTRYNHRLPGQFYMDPRPRAIAFVQKFDLPTDL